MMERYMHLFHWLHMCLTQPDHQICPRIQRVTLKTDFGNMDLALVQLEKCHVAGTFCTDVKSA